MDREKCAGVLRLDLSQHMELATWKNHFGIMFLLQTVMEYDKEMDIFLSRLKLLRKIDAYTWAYNLYHVYRMYIEPPDAEP